MKKTDIIGMINIFVGITNLVLLTMEIKDRIEIKNDMNQSKKEDYKETKIGFKGSL